MKNLKRSILNNFNDILPYNNIMNQIKAKLRCATHIKSAVPSRIVEADLTPFQRKGLVSLQFSYNNTNYGFVVPFTRPYIDKEAGKFANLLNLNQARAQNNLEFQALIERITNNYTANPAIEIACEIQLVRNDEER